MSEAHRPHGDDVSPEQAAEIAELAASLIARREHRELLLAAFPRGSREIIRDLLGVVDGLVDGTVTPATVRHAADMLADLRDMRSAVERGQLHHLDPQNGGRDG